MATTMARRFGFSNEAPPELARLRERIEQLPVGLRGELEELADQAIDDAIHRGRVLSIAKDALERQRLEIAAMRFDLHATRRELSDIEFGR